MLKGITNLLRRTMFTAVAAGLVSGVGLGIVNTASASAATCSLTTLQARNNAFNIHGTLASAPVKVTGPQGCTITVSLTSWNAPAGSTNFQPFQNQTFVAGRTLSIGPGVHYLHITVNPQCDYQADLLMGSNQRGLGAGGGANYLPSQVLGFIQVHTGVCGAPAPMPKPQPKPTPQPKPQPLPQPTPSNTTTTTTNTTDTTNNTSFCSGNVTNSTTSPASQGGNCSTNTTIIQTQAATPTPAPAQTQSQTQSQDQTQSATTTATTPATTDNTSATQTQSATDNSAPATETAAPASTPTTLVNTGPGEVVGLFVATALVGVTGYQFFLRRHLAK